MRKGFGEKSAQYNAVEKDRKALRAKGMSRFEVRALDRDKKLIRDLARRLAADGDAAKNLRSVLSQEMAQPAEKRMGIVQWLRESPLVGVDWYIEREFSTGRKVDI